MNNPGANDTDLLARALRGQLTEAERREFERRLSADHALRENFEEEQSLEQLLDRLPNVPVASNFTALVLQSVRADALREGRKEGALAEASSRPKWPWLRFRVARLASGLAVVTIVGVLTVNHYRNVEKEEMVQSVASFTEVASAMSPEQKPGLVFRDFEAIERLGGPAESELDLELLAALQK